MVIQMRRKFHLHFNRNCFKIPFKRKWRGYILPVIFCLLICGLMLVTIRTSTLVMPDTPHLISEYTPSSVQPKRVSPESVREVSRVQPKIYLDYLYKGLRLGNRMFQVASIYGICRTLGYSPVYDSRMAGYLQPFPNLSNATFVNVSQVDHADHLYEKYYAMHDQAMLQVIANHWPNDIVFSGFLQSFKYFIDYSQEIRSLFKLDERATSKARSELRQLRRYLEIRDPTKREVVFIGIHVRMDDLLLSKNIKRGYRLPDASYIYRAMDFFRRKYRNVAFIVFSDTLDWCHENIHGVDVHYPPGKRDVAGDFALLTACDHLIITTGTFGWWAAYLFSGEVIYFGDHLYHNSTLYMSFRREDYFLPHWIPMV